MLSWLFGSEPTVSRELQQAESVFTKSELAALRQQWSHLQADTSGGGGAVQLLGLLGLHHRSPWLAQRLVAVVSRGNGSVSLEDFIIAKARCLRRGDDEGAMFVFDLIAGDTPTPAPPRGHAPRAASAEDLGAAVAAAVAVAVPGGGDGGGAASDAAVRAVVAGALEKYGDGGGLPLPGFKKWAAAEGAAVVGALRSLLVQGTELRLPDSVSSNMRPPPLLADLEGRGVPLLLTPTWAWLLAAGMSAGERCGWRLLYNSDLHGKSYSTLTARIMGVGSTLLLLRDAAGALCGGFASVPWEKQGTFFGDFRCFVFRLAPTASLHRPTGANSHFLWCGVNFARLPNGLGWGGQEGYFGLFLDACVDSGMSRPCATYSNPCLASSQVFDVDAIEVWLVEPVASGDEVEGAAGGGGTVMDRFKEEAKIMEIAGMTTNRSDPYRRAEPIDEELPPPGRIGQ